MSSKNTPQDKATRHDTTARKSRKPVVNARPIAALVTNVALVSGATLAAAGGVPAVLSGAAAVGVASAAAVGTRKTKARLSKNRRASSPNGATRVGKRTPRSNGNRPSVSKKGTGKITGGKTGTQPSGTQKTPARRIVPSALRRKARSGSGTKPFRTPSAFRKAAAKTRNAATGTRKITAQIFRKMKAAATGTRKTFRKTPSGLRWLRNLWRKVTNPKKKINKKTPRKIPTTVADPKRKTTPRMAAVAPASPPAPQRPAIATTRTPIGRTTPVSIAATRMQELADEMLSTAAAFREQLSEKGSGIGLMHYANDCIALPQVIRTVGEALEQYRLAAEEHLPVAGIVADAVAEVRSSQASVADAAEAASSIIETVHAEELERLRNPQPNAHKADVTENVEV
jgi:hypothetical protein